jgi:hypothetical protein
LSIERPGSILPMFRLTSRLSVEQPISTFGVFRGQLKWQFNSSTEINRNKRLAFLWQPELATRRIGEPAGPPAAVPETG